jgi:hypothetical protein
MPGLIRGMDTRASDGSVGLDRSSSTAKGLPICRGFDRNTLGDYTGLIRRFEGRVGQSRAD